jgi:hypothetical protein
MTTGKFVFEWVGPAQGNDQQAEVDVPRRDTEVFVPDLISRGRRLVVQGLGHDQYYHDKSRQTLYMMPTVGGMHKITVTLDPPLQAAFRVNSFWDDFGARLVLLCACLVGLISYLMHSLSVT